ncbi:hypothetical protein CHUAL_008238 [Chamberlinius hualienensis]
MNSKVFVISIVITAIFFAICSEYLTTYAKNLTRQKRRSNCDDAYILTESERTKLGEMQNITEGKLDQCGISYKRREVKDKDAIPKYYYEAECAQNTHCCGSNGDGILQTVRSNLMYLANIDGQPTIVIKAIVVGCICSVTLPSSSLISSATMTM